MSKETDSICVLLTSWTDLKIKVQMILTISTLENVRKIRNKGKIKHCAKHYIVYSYLMPIANCMLFLDVWIGNDLSRPIKAKPRACKINQYQKAIIWMITKIAIKVKKIINVIEENSNLELEHMDDRAFNVDNIKNNRKEKFSWSSCTFTRSQLYWTILGHSDHKHACGWSKSQCYLEAVSLHLWHN